MDDIETSRGWEPIEGWQAIVDKLLLEYGWIAYCTNNMLPVGADVDCFGIPFVVFASATKAECVQQYLRVLEITGKKAIEIEPPSFSGAWMKLVPKGHSA